MLQLLCVGLIALALGLVLLFSGYRFFLLLLPIWGFFAGFGLAAGGVTLLFGDGFLATITGWVAGFFVGLIFGLLSYLFYIAGVAIFAGSIGYALGAGLVFWLLPGANIMAFVVGMVVAILIAALTILLNLQKYVIVALTAAGGATALIGSLLLFIGRVSVADLGTNPVQPVIADSFLWTVAWLVLIVIGISAQLATTRSYQIQPPPDNRAWSYRTG